MRFWLFLLLIGWSNAANGWLWGGDAPPTITGLATSVTTNRNTATTALTFTVGDDLTAVGSLTMSAGSSNPTLIPAVNCVFGGSGASPNRTVTITPANNQTGTATITITVTDGGGLTANQTIAVTVNALPTITGLATSVTTNRNTATTALTFTVDDDLTAVGSLTMSATSGNATLIPPGNCSFGGSGASRTVTITPATNQTGNATITITVTDGGGQTSNQSIVVAVSALPTITGLAANVTTNRNTATPALTFTVGDDLTAPASLTMSATSSNATLIPPGNCSFGGSGASRTVTITPATNQTGNATITITVTDGGGQTSDQLIVVAVSALPTITGLAASVTTNLSTPTPALGFTIDDDLTDDTALTVSASSSNVTLIPVVNCVFGGSGSGRTVTITPATGLTGVATITVTVTDGGGQTSSQAIAVTVNALPTITGLAASVATNRNTATAALTFTIGDDLTALTLLTMSAGSSNATLIPPANCVFGGSGASRTVTITPANNQVGSANITITVTDGGGLTASQVISVIVNAPPTITGLPGTLTINQYGASLDLPFTVGDDLTATASLTTAVTSSSLSVIPIANCVITIITPTVVGNPNRSLKITPESGLFADNIIIRVTVADGSSQTSFQEITVSVKEINRPPVISPETTAYNYSLNVSGYVQIVPDNVTVTDPDYVTVATPNGEPTLKTGSDYLRITARVLENGVADQDAMVVRNSNECTLNNKRGSKFDIVQRGTTTTTVLAEAILADDGLSLTITAKDGAETVAITAPTGGVAPGRAAVLGWLLKTISYTNLAGRFATTTNPTRTVEIQVVEGRPLTMPGGRDSVTVTSVITHLLANEPPASVAFNSIVVSPGGSGRIELTSTAPIDDQTPNDSLQFTLAGDPSGGDLIDLDTGLKITSFAGYRLNPAHTLFAKGVGYRNTKSNIGGDGFTLQIADASNLFVRSNVSVRITTNVTGEARIVSDPLLSMDRGTTKTYSLSVVGPTGSSVVFAVSPLPGFAAAPGSTAAPGSAVVVPTGLSTNTDGELLSTVPSSILTITAPTTGNYLAFLLTCTVGTRVTSQPFIIRLLPIASAGMAN